MPQSYKKNEHTTRTYNVLVKEPWSFLPAQCLPLSPGEENKLSLLGLGALSPLCQLINHEDKRVRRNAIMALGMMAANGVCVCVCVCVRQCGLLCD